MIGIFLKIVNISISASWIVLAVVLLRFILKKAPKWSVILLWGIVAVRLVFPFSIESVMSLIPSTETIPSNIMLSTDPIINSGVSAVNYTVNPIISEISASVLDSNVNFMEITVSLFAMIWVVGILILFVYSIISYLKLYRKVSTAVLIRDNIFQSENILSPFILGIIKPKIYVPFGMNGKDLNNVIAHEQAHISRRDHWWKPIGFLILTIYWFNPFMWIAYILLCRDIELACDEKVIKKLGKEQRADYSAALLSCSINRRNVVACPLAFGEVGVKERVKNILNYKKPTIWIIITAVILSLIVALCFLTNPMKPPIKFEDIEISWAETYDLRNGELFYYLNKAELDELEDRLNYLKIGEKDDDLAEFTPYYSLSIYANGSHFSIQGFDIEGESTALYYEGKYYRINDKDFKKYLGSVCSGEARIVATKPLTLDDVILLSQKGEDLTWSDFEDYDHIDTGSGLYIEIYDIDERYSLIIGGTPGQKPMYIRICFCFNTDMEEYIDIRTEDVQEFIDKHNYSISNIGGVDAPEKVIVKADSLDKAVGAVIMAHNKGKYFEGEFACESHVIIKTVSGTPLADSETSAVTVYAMVLYQEYDFSDNTFFDVSGGYSPIALTFMVSKDGEYTLQEYWEPRDGVQYESDIRAKFPKDIAEEAIGTQKYILSQQQACYAQAVEYGQIDTDYIIEQLLETICSSPAQFSNPDNYINEHSAERRELLYYGDYTLRYIFNEFLKGGQTDLRGDIMYSIMSSLVKPEGMFDSIYENAQKSFDEFREYNERIYSLNDAAFMQENCPKGWMLLQMINE